MGDYESRSHTTWTCNFHAELIPKCSARGDVEGTAPDLGFFDRKSRLKKVQS